METDKLLKMARPAPWPDPPGNSPAQQEDLNAVIAQARGFIHNLAALVNEINQLRVERTSMKYENEGLQADNLRLQKEVDLLESKMVLLEERMEKLEQSRDEEPATIQQAKDLPLDHDRIKAEFLEKLACTPRDWYLDVDGEPRRDEIVEIGRKKKIISLTSVQAVCNMESGSFPGFDRLMLTHDDLPAIKRACGLED